ncbi:GNAT family N-acetyltransferase [Dermatobacter hominis]|uniref:GNAT family N-acetyltransferase n=1 Tax=Dermatobacter hominis TaxID=2884263 RepID=UPI001D12B3A7|nr:N-acetyltransferase [Dermatobacter hominis]UDY35739.1 GNAT family N-acetyltransferase [Dermatobacter hominis]
MPHGADAQIRPFRPGDEAALMQVCLQTGDAGRDATPLLADGDLVGTIWCLPYLLLEPELASVVAVGDRPPRGYVLGALDTAAFHAAAAERYWPEVREQYPLDSYDPDTMDGLLVHVIHDRSQGAGGHGDLWARYPSHLHIDLLPDVQGQGFGRRLVERLLGQLAEHGSTGVHLGVNPANTGAIEFYRRLGFDEWDEPGDATSVTFVRAITPR